MAKEAKLLDAVGATGAGTAVQNPGRHKLFQAVISGTATVDIEGSLDNVNWVQLGQLTASGIVSDSDPWEYVRANVTAWTSGTVTVIMRGAS